LKLLFDENLSPRLVRAFANEFPGSSHVTSIGLAGASDQAIWEHAQAHRFAIISKDDDFRSLSLVCEPAPNVDYFFGGGPLLDQQVATPTGVQP
jgi:predicted nuclease of predicted toxin-antitoxin system